LLERFHHAFGIKEQALAWVKSYLSGRTQCVAVDDKMSSECVLEFGVPQGSVLGPKEYCMYTKPVADIARRHNMLHHTYADDTQAYSVLELPSEWTETSAHIIACMKDLKFWMDSNMLKLNQEKFEYIIFHPKTHRINNRDYTITIDDNLFVPSESVRNLGVCQDKSLTMEKHVATVVKSCYYQIRCISKIRKYITTDACKSLVQSNVISRLDYCNVLLHKLPKALLTRIQLVQNTCARLVTGTGRRDHITPVMIQLHWLPVEQRVTYKVLLYTFKAINGLAPSYISDLIVQYQPTRSLRSAGQSLLRVPSCRTVTYGSRSFRVAAPTLWNALPEDLRHIQTVAAFKKLLKTHLFRLAYQL
jgi:hypothetical protein